MKYFIYARKSSEDSEKQVLSIETQVERALKQFDEVKVVEVIRETGSAFKRFNRPLFAKMIDRIEAGEADGIIAWHPDRLSRNPLDAALVIDLVQRGVIKDLLFGSYTFDNSPEGIFMMQMVMGQSQYFSAKLSKDVKRGLEKKVSMGWTPGVAKVGYLNTPALDKGTRVVIEDPERFVLVRKMWDLMLTGNYSIRRITQKANTEWGFTMYKRRKVGGGPLGLSTAHKIFTSQFYAGLLEFKGEVYPGSHKPMITLDEFDRVQEILGRKGKPRPKSHRFTYTGLIRCGECGCMYTAETKTKTNLAGLKRFYTYYHCTRKSAIRKCTQRTNIREEELERQIEELLSSFTILPEFKNWALEALNSTNDSEIEERIQIQRSLAGKAISTQKELDSLTQMRYRELISDEEYLDSKRRLKETLRGVQSEQTDIEVRAEKWLELTEEAFDFATHALENFRAGDMETRKAIVAAIGQNPLALNGKLEIRPNPWLVPIAEHYPAVQAEYDKVRTTKYSSAKTKTAAMATVNDYWLRGEDSNLRPSD